LADVREIVHHALDPTTALSISAGVTVARSRQTPSDPFRVVPYPNGDVALSRRFNGFGHQGDATLSLDAGLVPVIDQITGLVTNRVQALAALTDRLDEVVTLRGSASAAQTVPTSEPYALTLLAGNLEVAFRTSRFVSLALGERAWWQDQAQSGSFLSTFSYFNVTVATAPAHF
jgi:hypothetical protein